MAEEPRVEDISQSKIHAVLGPQSAEQPPKRDRQQEIESLRAQQQDEFDRIEGLMPELDELLLLSIEPPQELLDEDW